MVDVSVTEAKARLSELIACVERGEDVHITRHGHRAVSLVLFSSVEVKREFGLTKYGWIADDFDDALPDSELALWE